MAITAAAAMAWATGWVGPARAAPAARATAVTRPPWVGRRWERERRVWLLRSNQPALKARRCPAGVATRVITLPSESAMIQRATGADVRCRGLAVGAQGGAGPHGWVTARPPTVGMMPGMTRAKIAVSLPPELVAQANRAVDEGRAGSVSAYVAAALEEKAKLDDLSSLLTAMLTETGGPLSADERRQADRALGR